MSKMSMVSGIVLLAALATNSFGYELTTDVWVNGVRLTQGQLREAERLYGGTIADGRYWLDPQTGVWGYEGGPAQGRLGDGVRRGAYHRRVPGGYIGSDGSTSYYYDSENGCSVIPGGGVSC